MRSEASRPGVPASTTNAEIARVGVTSRASSLFANTTYRSAMPPFEIQVFAPFSTQPSASRRAVVESAATSEPASGSDSANAAIRNNFV